MAASQRRKPEADVCSWRVLGRAYCLIHHIRIDTEYALNVVNCKCLVEEHSHIDFHERTVPACLEARNVFARPESKIRAHDGQGQEAAD